MRVVQAVADDEAETVFVAGPSPQDQAYYSAVVLAPVSGAAPRPAPVRPSGPRPGDVVVNPRAGGLMTVQAVDREDGIRVWAQWFGPDGEYGSGSFPVDASGRVVDHPAAGR